MSLVLKTEFEKGSLVEGIGGQLFTQVSYPAFRRSTKGLGLYTKSGYVTKPSFTYNPTNKISFELAVNVHFIDFASYYFVETLNSLYTLPHLIVFKSGTTGIWSATAGKYLEVSYHSHTGSSQQYLQSANFFSYLGDYHIIITMDFSSTVCNFYRNGRLFSTTNAIDPQFPDLNYTLKLFSVNYYTNYGLKYFDHVMSADEVEDCYQEFSNRKSLSKPVKSFYVPPKPRLQDSGLLASYDFMNTKNKKLVNVAPPSSANSYNPSQYDGTITSGAVTEKDALKFGTLGAEVTLPVNIFNRPASTYHVVFKREATARGGWGIVWGGGSFTFGVIELGSVFVLYLNVASPTICLVNNLKNVVTITVTAAQQKIYLNGNFVASYDYAITMPVNQSKLGRDANPNREFRGKIYDFKIYDRVLSEREIKDYYNSFVSKPVVIEDFSNYPVSCDVTAALANTYPRKIPKNWIRKAGTFEIKETSPAVDDTTNLLTNTFDWVDDNSDGIGNGWGRFYGSEVCSIVTGNGFTGRAQRMDASVGGTAQALRFTPEVIKTYVKMYRLTLKYRCNRYIALYKSSAESMAAIPANAGDASTYTCTLYSGYSPTSAGQLCFYLAAKDDWFEISDVVLTEMRPSVEKFMVVTSFSTSNLVATKSDVAYGTWEFDWFHGTTGYTTYVSFMNAANGYVTSAGTFGYLMGITTNDAVVFYRQTPSLTGGFYTATSYVKVRTWYSMRITRDTTGNFTVWIKGDTFVDWTLVSPISGTNPIVDNTYTTSKYFVLDVDYGDAIANIKIYPGIVV